MTGGVAELTWLITGSSRGFGRALAVAALEAGDRVAATARDPAQVADLAKQYPNRALPVALDVTDQPAARRAFEAALEKFGRVDVDIPEDYQQTVGEKPRLPAVDGADQLRARAISVLRPALLGSEHPSATGRDPAHRRRAKALRDGGGRRRSAARRASVAGVYGRGGTRGDRSNGANRGRQAENAAGYSDWFQSPPPPDEVRLERGTAPRCADRRL